VNGLSICTVSDRAFVTVLTNNVFYTDSSEATGDMSGALLPLIHFLLQKANITIDDINLIACVCGPGSYTGIRIGIATALGLSIKNEIRCVGASMLYAMAMDNNLSISDGEEFFVCLDASKKVIKKPNAIRPSSDNYYSASFKNQNGKIIRLTPDIIIPKNSLPINSKIIDGIPPNITENVLKIALNGDGLPSMTPIYL